MNEAEAAARLMERSLAEDVERTQNTIRFRRRSHLDLTNMQQDYEMEVRLVEVVRDDVLFFVVKVYGVSDDYEGYALPTHSSRPGGAHVLGDLDDELINLAKITGINIHGT